MEKDFIRTRICIKSNLTHLALFSVNIVLAACSRDALLTIFNILNTFLDTLANVFLDLPECTVKLI